MTRHQIDCRAVPNEIGCTLTLSGEPDEVLTAAAQHAIAVHGHSDVPELREGLRAALTEESPTTPGTFIQLIEFRTDRPAEYDAIVDRWADAIGLERTARWGLLATDRDHPGEYLAVVEFPDYHEAMANSDHPATSKFLAELRTICTDEPRFRNLDTVSARTY